MGTEVFIISIEHLQLEFVVALLNFGERDFQPFRDLMDRERVGLSAIEAADRERRDAR